MWALPNVEENRGAKDNRRKQVLLGFCQARHHICNNLIEDCRCCQQEASIASHLHNAMSEVSNEAAVAVMQISDARTVGAAALCGEL